MANNSAVLWWQWTSKESASVDKRQPISHAESLCCCGCAICWGLPIFDMWRFGGASTSMIVNTIATGYEATDVTVMSTVEQIVYSKVTVDYWTF